MPDISRITLPTGTTYDIKDTVARQAATGAIKMIEGTCTTALEDGSTTNPITVNGESVTAVANNAVFYGNKEFVFDGTYWHEFGDMTGLGALAMKDSASGSYTPAGTVSQPTFTGSQANVTITSETDASGNYQPAGSVSAPTISVNSAGATTSVYSITAVGTLPEFTATVSDETLTLGFSQGTLPTKGSAQTVKTGDASYTATAPTFTGTKVTLSGTVTAEGTVSQPTFTGTAATIEVS